MTRSAVFTCSKTRFNGRDGKSQIIYTGKESFGVLRAVDVADVLERGFLRLFITHE